MLRISWSTESTALAGGDLVATSTEHTYEFDAVTSENHEGVSILTEHAVEDGAPLTDHKRATPRRVTIEATVTNTPLDRPPPSGYGEADQAEASIRKDGDSAAVVVFSVPFDRIGDSILTLERLRLEATPITLSTARRTYDQVQIVSVSEPRSAEDGDTQRFVLEIQEVRKAQSRTVDAPRPREPRGAQERDRGGQEGTGADEVSTLQAAREEYNRRRAAGESRTDAAMGALDSAFGG